MTWIQKTYSYLNRIYRKYANTIGDLLTEKSYRNLLNLQIILTLAFVINYALSFTSLYELIYDYIPNRVYEVYAHIYIALPKIEKEMQSHGDFPLFSIYVVFSLFNLSTLLLSVVFPWFLHVNMNEAKMSVRSHIVNPVRFFIVYFISVLILLFSILVLNEAGYNNPRFPIHPALGRGPLYFIRDTGLLWVVSVVTGELVVVVRLLFRRPDWGGDNAE